MARLLLLNGPNLNLLGTREPAVYGSATLASIEQRAAAVAKEAGHELAAFQSNAEHELIERIHQAGRDGRWPSSFSIQAASPTRAWRCAMRCSA